MTQQTTKKSCQFYQSTHRLKSMRSMEEKNERRKSLDEESKQHGINTDDLFERLKSMRSMEENNKQRKSIEEESKQHGINTDDLFEERVISNKNCFWSLLQSQTDRMHYFFHQEEKYIIDNLTDFERTGSLTPALLENIRKHVLWLQDFVTFNIHRFEAAVSEFDAEHNCDTFEDELEYFEETYPFTNRERLTLILDAIDEFTSDVDNFKQKHHFQNSLSGDSHDGRKKSVLKKKRSFRRFVSICVLRLLE